MKAGCDALDLMQQALSALDRAKVPTTAGCYLQLAIDLLADDLAEACGAVRAHDGQSVQ